MIQNILPQLFNNDAGNILDRATIVQDGARTVHHNFLQNYVDGK
jgi:hypothetical protein